VATRLAPPQSVRRCIRHRVSDRDRLTAAPRPEGSPVQNLHNLLEHFSVPRGPSLRERPLTRRIARSRGAADSGMDFAAAVSSRRPHSSIWRPK
jgi:hypothetical protein